MHFVIKNIIENCFRDLIIAIHTLRLQYFFSKPEMNVENGCLFFCFIFFNFFAAISIDWKSSEIEISWSKSLWTEKISRSVIVLTHACTWFKFLFFQFIMDVKNLFHSDKWVKSIWNLTRI